ncbi:MAG: M23 family metallopeptidase [Propionibacteriaceae bacterium]|nr:M23 family metallopeptidase [Propionibacteriaceae bacterium]
MRLFRFGCAVVATVMVVTLEVSWCPPAGATDFTATAPTLGDVVRGFDHLEHNWDSGHRGVDIATTEGSDVVAAMDGVVSFAGMVAGRPVLSIRHGDLTTTYEPVRAVVRPGTQVVRGEKVGEVILGHPCPGDVCLHWGVKQGENYLDPLSFLQGGDIHLITKEAFEEVREHAKELVDVDGRLSEMGLAAPSSGVVTSAYGMRRHPIEGVWRFHDGVDIASSCGTPLRAAASGKVVESYYHSGYGNRLIIDHGDVQGQRVKTGYNHAQGYGVRVGDHVTQGQVVGLMGTTGSSTGCHLHYQVWVGGSLINPASSLP